MINLGRNLALQSVLAKTQGHKRAPIYEKCSGLLRKYRNVKVEEKRRRKKKEREKNEHNTGGVWTGMT